MASAQPISQASHRGPPPVNNVQQATSPPSKGELKSWWGKFGGRIKKVKVDDQVPLTTGIFGVPLSESILYANVAISLTNEQGESFIYGYVPIVVAKCGVFLKEKATDVEGIFRLSGSAKRIKDLQTIFNSPERYGKGLDWTGYTVHDAANILRRYLNQLPEPIVPLGYYEHFRDPLRDYQAKVDQAKAGDDTQPRVMENQEHSRAVVAYQKLITELPALNRQLLLYILDLLAVFASKSDLNRMTAQNLAAIFQPGIISHPNHHMAPNEYRLSQDVLIFLIENQDNFLIGMSGTAMDEKTKDEVKSGPPSIKTPKTAIGRSASTASAGADSVRRTAGVRRNGSMSSRNSRGGGSPGVSSPTTPASPSGMAPTTGGAGGGLGRSNTVPSNRSPAVAGSRFQRASEVTSSNTHMGLTPLTNPVPPGGGPGSSTEGESTAFPSTSGGGTGDSNYSPQDMNVQNTAREPTSFLHGTDIRMPIEQGGNAPAGMEATTPVAVQDVRPGQDVTPAAPASGKSGNRDRKISNLLSISPMFGPSDQIRDPNQRQPRKLQKRRIPGSHNESAQSSQASLNTEEGSYFHSSGLAANNSTQDRAHQNESNPPNTQSVSTPTTELPPPAAFTTSPTAKETPASSRNLMPPHSPTTSIHSRGSATDPSDLDALDDPAIREEKRRQRFRLSSARTDAPLAPPPSFGQLPGARTSNSSLGSNRPRKSFTGDSQLTQTSVADASSTGQPSFTNFSSRESGEPFKEHQGEPEKKGLFGRFKAKMSQSRENYEAERERAKSPPRVQGEHANSKGSLSAFTHEHFVGRGRSFDGSREGSVASQVPDRAQTQNLEIRSAQTQPQFQTQVQPPTPVPGPTFVTGSNHAAPASASISALPPQEQPRHSNTFPLHGSSVGNPLPQQSVVRDIVPQDGTSGRQPEVGPSSPTRAAQGHTKEFEGSSNDQRTVENSIQTSGSVANHTNTLEHDRNAPAVHPESTIEAQLDPRTENIGTAVSQP